MTVVIVEVVAVVVVDGVVEVTVMRLTVLVV